LPSVLPAGARLKTGITRPSRVAGRDLSFTGIKVTRIDACRSLADGRRRVLEKSSTVADGRLAIA
jgi:hypothetical protein